MIPADKARHFLGCAALVVFLYVGARLIGEASPEALLMACGLTAAIAAGKEICDLMHPREHDAEWLDLAADALGIGTAALAIVLVT